MYEVDTDQIAAAQSHDTPHATEAEATPRQTSEVLPGVSPGLLQRKIARRREGAGEIQFKAGNREDVPSGSESSIAEHGFSGSTGALPYRAEMEAGFGRSFSDTQVYMGGPALKANEALGAEAYAMGNKVAFKSENPDKAVVAHELAHTIQQSGGSAVQTYASTSPDAMEAEADAAAATVLSGGKAEIALRTAGSVSKWAGSDHYAIGNLGGQKALQRFQELFPDAKNGPKTKEVDVVHGGAQGEGGAGGMKAEKGETIAVGTGKDTSISMGEASRFGGDYTSSPDGLKGRNQEGGTKANWNPLDWRATHEYSSMALIAATNANHFYPLNRIEWAGHHQKAVQAAAGGDMDAAMREEGFAAHFLQDTFSSGHMAPRSLDSIPHMKDGWDMKLGDARQGLSRSKTWHDFFCMLPNGLPTTRGRFHGDNYMDGNDLETTSNAVRDSMLEVLSAGQGKGMSFGVAAQVPAPDINQILSDPEAGPAWRLMQDAYKEDMAKAKKEIKQGDKGKTAGDTEFDSKAVLDEIEQNVMGSGDAPQGQKSRAQIAGEKKAALLGTLGNIHHYLGATWDVQRHLNQDDDVVSKTADKPHYKMDKLEETFKLFSTAQSQSTDYVNSLSEYVGKATGENKAVGEKALEEAKAIQTLATEWKKLADDAGSWFTRSSTVEKYRKRIEKETTSAMSTLRGTPELQPENNEQKK